MKDRYSWLTAAKSQRLTSHLRIVAEIVSIFNFYCVTMTFMEGLTHYEKIVRPWGNFERFTLNEPTTVKLLTLNPGQSTSLQTHDHRDEFWHVVKGSGTFRIGDTETAGAEGAEFFSPRQTRHRITSGPEGLLFLEISFGDFDESDITRLEDDYGRVS